MIDSTLESATITEAKPRKVYNTSILKIARYFGSTVEATLIRDLAEEFRRRPHLPAVAVIDEDGKALGIVRAERLFAMLGKPFGQEILGKCRVGEVMDDCSRWPARAELFSVAAEALTENGDESRRLFLLEEEDGRFVGIFSAQDLADHLSGITRQDVEYAGKLQERLIAGHESLRGEGWRFEGWSRSAKGIGGDLYFAKAITEDESFFCLCDISGKGVSASVLVSMAWGMLRMYDYSEGLGRLIMELNSAVVEAFHMEKYLTGIFMTWNGAKRRLKAADMGHSHILVFRNGVPGHIRSAKTNLPIGLEQDIVPAFNTWNLRSGDVIFVYSDGFIEQENGNGLEFGEARLQNAVSTCIKAGKPISEGLPQAFDSWRGAVPPQDDASFIALHIE